MSEGSPEMAAGRRSAELAVHVPAMDCAGCASRIRDRLQAVPGVGNVEARVVARELRVKYDPQAITRDRVLEALAALGFDVEAGAERRTGERFLFSAWRSREALLVYASGALLAAGLLLRLLDSLGTVTSVSIPWLGSALLTAAAAVGASRFVGKAVRSARRLELDMHFLMSAAILGAILIGEFVEAGSIAFLFGLAELLEDHAVARARRSIQSLVDLTPTIARVVRDGEERVVPTDSVQVGELVRIRPGDRVPVDGSVEEGLSWVDESAITGEPLPADKARSSSVYAGSMNGGGYLEVRTAKAAQDTTLAHIIHRVEEAEESRAPIQRFVDQFARIYTPAVVALAVLVMAVPPLLLAAPFETWVVRGLTLLVISCPCALVISTPVTVVSAITSAARNGVLIKGGTHLEAVADIEVVAFDKTGTLTARSAEVTDVVIGLAFARFLQRNGGQADREAVRSEAPQEWELLRWAGVLESRSEHPIAEAIRRKARSWDAPPPPAEVTEFEAQTGLGARARLNGEVLQIGRPDIFPDFDAWAAVVDRLTAEGKTVVCVGSERETFGAIAVRDQPRKRAREAIAQLRALGVRRIVMLTGDRRVAAEALARELEVDEVHAELLPEDKVEVVRRLQREAGAVAMVGDGVNDAPALAAATVGIAMGAAGSDAALETAHVALMGDDIAKLPYLFRLSRLARRVLRQNVAASIFLKTSLALGVFPGWVSLITAVLVGDMGASLGVTANALRLGHADSVGERGRKGRQRSGAPPGPDPQPVRAQ